MPLEGVRVLIIGGGELAARKMRLLSAANAAITTIAPTIEVALRDEFQGRAELIEREATGDDFVGATLAIIAVDDRAEQERFAQIARDQRVLVNVVDAPDLCDFTTPSMIDHGDLVVAIATNGKAPVLGRTLRGRIEQMVPREMGELVTFAGAYRESVKARFGPQSRDFWEQFFDGSVAQRFLSGDRAGAHELMMKQINGQSEEAILQGCVHIVGAGPGDPELLTIRAHRILQQADVIFYDRLVGDGIMDLARRDAERIFVGKAKANHAVPQDEIQSSMVARARAGQMVVRLKGGDPFVFGRGGEEQDALEAAGIDVFITPGITAATGCAAASGMPLTHRDFSQAVTFVTGHARGDSEPDLDWRALADLKHTLVVYMGVSKAEKISEQLVAHGRDGQTPIAAIENGTCANQIVAQGTLATLSKTLRDADIHGPAILVIGDVARFAKTSSNHEFEGIVKDAHKEIIERQMA